MGKVSASSFQTTPHCFEAHARYSPQRTVQKLSVYHCHTSTGSVRYLLHPAAPSLNLLRYLCFDFSPTGSIQGAFLSCNHIIRMPTKKDRDQKIHTRHAELSYELSRLKSTSCSFHLLCWRLTQPLWTVLNNRTQRRLQDHQSQLGQRSSESVL